MAKRTAEIKDTLQDRVDNALEKLQNQIESYVKDSQLVTIEEIQDGVADTISEITDGSVPVYTTEIDDLWYLYSNEFEEAYENAGIGSNPRENNGMTAIFAYIEAALSDWLYGSDGEDFIDDLLEKEYQKERARLLSETYLGKENQSEQ